MAVKEEDQITLKLNRLPCVKEYLKRDLEKKRWTYKYSWKKMEAAAWNTAEWRKVACAYVPAGATRFKLQLHVNLHTWRRSMYILWSDFRQKFDMRFSRQNFGNSYQRI